MTISFSEQHQATAERLASAYVSNEAIDPISSDSTLTIDDAYAIQLAQVTMWRAAGRSVKGYKVGLTSKAMQSQLGVDQPDFGHLLTGHFFAEHQPIDHSAFLQPKIEPEIAFVLGSNLTGPDVSVADAIRAVDFVLPSLEIIDSRIRDWKIGIVDTVADNASCGGIVLGSTPTPLDAVDLARVGCVLTVQGSVVATGAGGAVLGSPINALVWLANTLGARGIGFKAGDVILPGSVTAAVPISAGSTVSAQFAGLGTVTAAFR